MSDDRIDKDNPSEADWLALLDALRGEARAGRLCSLTFMLRQPENPHNAVIDHFGSAELTEIACRKTVETIAVNVEQVNATLAKAIRSGMPSQVRH